MAFLAGAVVNHLSSSFNQDNGSESDNNSFSDHSSPPSLELLENVEEEPPVAYLTPINRSKSGNGKKAKSSERSFYDEQSPSLSSSSESEGRRTKRREEVVSFTPLTSSSKTSTDVEDEGSTRDDLMVTSTERVHRKRSNDSTVICGLTKSPSSDDAVEYTPQRFKKGHARANPKKTVCSLFDFETAASKPQLTDELGDTNQQASVLMVLKDISTTLNNLVGRVQNTEKNKICEEEIEVR